MFLLLSLTVNRALRVTQIRHPISNPVLAILDGAIKHDSNCWKACEFKQNFMRHFPILSRSSLLVAIRNHYSSLLILTCKILDLLVNVVDFPSLRRLVHPASFDLFACVKGYLPTNNWAMSKHSLACLQAKPGFAGASLNSGKRCWCIPNFEAPYVGYIFGGCRGVWIK